MPSVSGNVGAVASVSSVFGRNGGVVAANGDYSGVVAAHLTGATAATRYVGGTASGAPVAGTFAVGDFVIEQTGKVYVCTVAGTPGTWVAPGGSIPVLARNVGQASFDFAEDVAAAGGQKHLALSFDSGDATLVTLTSPTDPQIVTPGVYAFTATLQVTLNTTPSWSAGLLVDNNYYSIAALTARVAAGDDFGFSSTSVTWWCDAQDPFAVLAQVAGGAVGSDHFAGQLYVQRVA